MRVSFEKEKALIKGLGSKVKEYANSLKERENAHTRLINKLLDKREDLTLRLCKIEEAISIQGWIGEYEEIEARAASCLETAEKAIEQLEIELAKRLDEEAKARKAATEEE